MPASRVCVEAGCTRIFKPSGPGEYRCDEHRAAHRRRGYQRDDQRRKLKGKRRGTSSAIRRLRPIVLARDEWTCFRCGCRLTQRPGPRQAQLHHVDLDPTNDVEENLVACCRTCNLEIGGRRG